MSDTPYFTLILPAYNERNMIGRTITDAQNFLEKQGFTYEIIVSADGNDGTREFVAKMAESDGRISVIGHENRRGKGFAIRQGVFMSKGSIVGFADADNKTPISELEKVLPWFDEGYDLVIGSRAMNDSKIQQRQPWYRQIGSKGFGVFRDFLLSFQDIPDTQCGFKFFRHDVAMDLFSRQKIDGYMYDVEILYLAKRIGYRIQQVGIEWQDDGDSRLEIVRGNLQSAIDVINLRLGIRDGSVESVNPVPPPITEYEDSQ